MGSRTIRLGSGVTSTMSDTDHETEQLRVQRERDLYLGLLELGAQTELEPFLEGALALVVGLSGASQGYLEIRDRSEADEWWMAQGCTDLEIQDIRTSISRGIIAEALATGETVVTQSALLDERFRASKSVRIHKIEAVLCVPFGGDDALGVLYLQGRQEPGPFSERHCRQAEVFARHLGPHVERLLIRKRVADAADETRELRERYRIEGIIGRSRALAVALRQAVLAAPLDVNVLLTGESGTGKSQLARTIHANSPRSAGPFVELNCATIAPDLFESELFGALKGSHSTATTDRAGKVAAAEGGTLFLDEVAEIPVEQQAKLLQLLQSRTYFPLGASAPVEADIRLVAATNCDLEIAVKEKRFREDFFFRLQVLPVRVPALRERREDLSELAQALAQKACERHRLPPLELSPGALRAVVGAEWPGNVRHLENHLEAAAVRASGDRARQIQAHHVFPDRVGEEPEDARALTFQESTRRFQRDLLERALDEAHWNVSEAARRLDLARSHVYNLIEAFGLKRR
jgi:Nif-specific regulatory protein